MKSTKLIIVKSGNVQVRIYCRRRKKAGAVYPQFDVADYSSGHRKFVSFADEGKARRKATEIGTKLAKGEVAVLGFTSQDRTAYLRAMELLKPTQVPIELAAAQFAEAHQRLGGRSLIEAVNFFIRQHPVALPRKRVSEVVEVLLKAKRDAGLSDCYLQDLKVRLGRFAADFQCDIGSITSGQVREWLQAMPVANRTKNNFRLIVHTLCNFAKDQRFLPKDWDELDAVPTWKEQRQKVEIFTPEEMNKLLGAVSQETIPFLAIGAFAGLRSAEIQRLDWSKVNLATGYITVDADIAKTNSRRMVPMLPNLRKWLEPLAKPSGPVANPSSVAQAIRRLGPGKSEKDEVPTIAWCHNGLRHSFCTYRLASVKNIAQVALEAGNSPAMIRQHYMELVTEAEANRWFSIEPQAPANVVALPAAAVA